MPLTNKELLKYVEETVKTGKNNDVLENDSEMIVFLLDNCEIKIPQENRFFFRVDCEEAAKRSFNKRVERFSVFADNKELIEGARVKAYNGHYDFGHTSAPWESVISLGIYGLRNRMIEYSQLNRENEKAQSFYKNLISVYDAALRFIERSANTAESMGKTEMANGLKKLCVASPTCLFEAMQTTIVYYILQTCFDGTNLRTLGRLDSLFYPYYEKEDKEKAKGMIVDFLNEIDRLGAVSNIPFAIGGTDLLGNTLINELSYEILDAYKNSELTNTKLHFLCSENTPDDIIKSAFVGIRSGKNSIVFMSDERVIRALEKIGAEHDDAVRYSVVGCYESGAYDEVTCSCNASINIPKALELAINNGRDAQTGMLIGLENNGVFEDHGALFNEFGRQLEYLCKNAMKITDLYEMHYPEFHSAPILSGTYLSALESGKDLYADFGAKYNNSSLNAIGLATAADSLLAIKKAVFEDKLLTLEEFRDVLNADWAGKEALRLLIKNKYPKYGQGDESSDAVAKEIVDILANAVNGRPNVKGGKYRLGLFSINWRWDFGEKTAASADGRKNRETLSQNTGAVFGADKEGVTAHMLSASRLDTERTPNGAVIDIDLHESAVKGENGIKALLSSLRGYFALGGFAVHYNVLNTDILKKAKLSPESFPTLQVRLCGWNVLFSSLSEKEKDEFIARSEK